MTYLYERTAAKTLDLSDYNLEGLIERKPVTLYHGTTKLFRSFDMSLSRDELVNRFYGRGIFLTPSKRVAAHYADANRNIGFDRSLIQNLKRKNGPAGAFLEALYLHGQDGWEKFMREEGFFNENPPPGEGTMDLVGFKKYLGMDPNTLGDIAGYIIGSKTKPLGSDDEGTINIFNMSTGAPSWLYDLLDEIGLESNTYRPKVYTVSVTVENTLITASQTEARRASSQGYDCVVYYGSDLVSGVPEVAVFNPRNVRVKHIEVV